jgi:hypothetical protein
MHDKHGGNGMETKKIETTTVVRALEEEQDCTELVRNLLDGAALSEKEYLAILKDCDRLEVSERELWARMALYLKKGVIRERASARLELDDSCGQKMRKRILTLIGRLPYESLEEFRGLIAFTNSFLQRTAYLCDLLVYLFAEREKGLMDNQEIDTLLYTDFFVDKFLWELEKIRQFGEQTSFKELDGYYVDWLTDRILDGEVLA